MDFTSKQKQPLDYSNKKEEKNERTFSPESGISMGQSSPENLSPSRSSPEQSEPINWVEIIHNQQRIEALNSVPVPPAVSDFPFNPFLGNSAMTLQPPATTSLAALQFIAASRASSFPAPEIPSFLSPNPLPYALHMPGISPLFAPNHLSTQQNYSLNSSNYPSMMSYPSNLPENNQAEEDKEIKLQMDRDYENYLQGREINSDKETSKQNKRHRSNSSNDELVNPEEIYNLENQNPDRLIYLEKRRKNNKAAKRSRDSRRRKEEENKLKADFHEKSHYRLLKEAVIASKKTEIVSSELARSKLLLQMLLKRQLAAQMPDISLQQSLNHLSSLTSNN